MPPALRSTPRPTQRARSRKAAMKRPKRAKEKKVKRAKRAPKVKKVKRARTPKKRTEV